MTVCLGLGPHPLIVGILGIPKDLNIILIISCGHYYWVGAYLRYAPKPRILKGPLLWPFGFLGMGFRVLGLGFRV